MADIGPFVYATMGEVAQQTAGFLRGRVLGTPSPGRYLVSLASGALVTLSCAQQCYEPSQGESVDISNNNGIMRIEGPSAFG